MRSLAMSGRDRGLGLGILLKKRVGSFYLTDALFACLLFSLSLSLSLPQGR